MLDLRLLSARFSVFATACLVLAACSNLSGASDKVVNVVSPYKIDLIQGNVVTREQLAVLRVGMPRNQVRDILGSALLTSVFHSNRWDYVFTLKSQGREPQSRRVTVFFANDVLERTEADELPSESEFVATLKSSHKSGPLPVLEASQESLSKFPAAVKPPVTPARAQTSSDGYPPLESKGK